MANRITWIPDKSLPITSFSLMKSTDKSISFTLLASVLANANDSAAYDKQTGRYYYNDMAGNPGDVYAITSVGPAGTSRVVYALAPADPPGVCTVVGYVRDAFGYVDQAITILVSAFGTPGERWVVNPNGLLAQNSQALGLVSRTATLAPDANGLWQIDLVRKAYAKVEIPALDFTWIFEVPNKSGPINVRDIPQLRGQALELFPEMQGDRSVLPNS